jgi:transposase
MLNRISKSKTEELRRVQRATILLMASNGEGDAKIAEAVKLNKNSVRNTISKFNSMGIQAALSDLARKGRPANIDDEDKAWIKSQACVKPKDLGYARELWTINKLTSHIRSKSKETGHESLCNIASSNVWTILNEDKLKPHKIQYFLERRDPEFEQKKNNILMVYKEIDLIIKGNKESDVVTVSYDEKPGIQAIANIAPDLAPTKNHGFVGRDYEYKRLGTVSLLAGLNLIDGEVVALARESHNSSDFIDFLRMVDARYDSASRIRIVLDNHSAHTSKETRKYLDGCPGRFEFVFTPKHGSWLNLIESFFGKFSRVCLRGIRVNSKQELIDRIYQYINEINEVPVVYHWKYKINEVDL